jgi:transposase
LSRNTVRSWLRQREVVEPKYPARVSPSILDPYKEQLATWLRTDSHRPKRDRRTAQVMFRLLQEQGYPGGYGRVAACVRRWHAAGGTQAGRQSYVPLRFAPGEAFQFDWSCEYATVGGLRRRLELAHVKLAASRAFWLVAYPLQSHEMLFDAHTRAFAAFGGVPRRGIYDNMKTAVDKVGRGKERTINARFQAMCSHYLFEPEFCNRAAGWEKGVVEKNVQDRRRQLWQAVIAQSWASVSALNDWLAEACCSAWAAMRHPDNPQLTVAEALAEERGQLMPMPRPFDGYIEQPVRVSATALVHFQRNRYSVPTEYAHRIVSLRAYPHAVVLVADGAEIARHARRFERYQTVYDWQHYIPLLARKPGALRNGAPFAEMPAAFQRLQRQLLRQPGGDRVMALVLAAVPEHGVEAVEAAVELALEAGRPSGEHVLNVLARLLAPVRPPDAGTIVTALTLKEEPRADVQRYDDLLSQGEESCHVE